MFYVCINDIPDSNLEFCGYVKVFEDADFQLYQDYHGVEYIVNVKPPRYLMVEDYNDANCIKASFAIQVQR
jgi:hypothetical protein